MSTSAALGIKPHKEQKVLLYRKGKTKDIVKVTLDVEQTDRDDTQEFAKNFAPTKAGLKRLYRWVKHTMKYQEDPPGVQWIQTPSYLHHTKIGDCKSFTVFICSVLHNMGLDYIIRFTSYTKKDKRLTHVYVIAILPDGRKVPMDVVYSVIGRGPEILPDAVDRFGEEKPFKHKKDFYKSNHMTAIYKLGNIPHEEEMIRQMSAAVQDIDPGIVNAGPGDITRMTKGQLDRWIMSERMKIFGEHARDSNAKAEYYGAARAIQSGSISGIGSMSATTRQDIDRFLRKTARDTQPAFKIPSGLPGINGIGKALRELIQRFVNWLVKGILTAAAPYFLFLFLKKKTTAKIEARKAKQMRTFAWIRTASGIHAQQLLAMIYNGIVKKTGMTPQAILNSRGPTIAGAGFVAIAGKVMKHIVGAVKFIIQIVKKITSLFRKKESEAGEFGEGAMSDIRLLEELPDGSNPGGDSGNGTGGGQSGGGSSGGGTKGNGLGPQSGGGNNNNNSGGGSTGMLAVLAAGAFYAFS